MMRKGTVTLAAAVLLAVIPAAAEAACSKTGTFVQVLLKDDRVSGAHTLFLRDRVTDSFYFKATTKDDDLAAMAATLAAQQTRVKLKGSISSCPTAPGSGGVSIGKVVEIQAVP
jgi:hypothetical protein